MFERQFFIPNRGVPFRGPNTSIAGVPYDSLYLAIGTYKNFNIGFERCQQINTFTCVRFERKREKGYSSKKYVL